MTEDEALFRTIVGGMIVLTLLVWFFTTWSAILQMNAASKRIVKLLQELVARDEASEGPRK